MSTPIGDDRRVPYSISIDPNIPTLIFVCDGRACYTDLDGWDPSSLGDRERAIFDAFVALARKKLAKYAEDHGGAGE